MSGANASPIGRSRQLMTPRQALALVKKHGVMLESARGPVPNLVDTVVGGTRRGSWWTHPRAREVFALTRSLRDSPEILVTRFVNGHITYVHRRLWVPLVRIASALPKARIARVREVHTASGAHRLDIEPFPRWVPDDVAREAKSLSNDAAVRELGDWVIPLLS